MCLTEEVKLMIRYMQSVLAKLATLARSMKEVTDRVGCKVIKITVRGQVR